MRHTYNINEQLSQFMGVTTTVIRMLYPFKHQVHPQTILESHGIGFTTSGAAPSNLAGKKPAAAVCKVLARLI